MGERRLIVCEDRGTAEVSTLGLDDGWSSWVGLVYSYSFCVKIWRWLMAWSRVCVDLLELLLYGTGCILNHWNRMKADFTILQAQCSLHRGIICSSLFDVRFNWLWIGWWHNWPVKHPVSSHVARIYSKALGLLGYHSPPVPGESHVTVMTFIGHNVTVLMSNEREDGGGEGSQMNRIYQQHNLTNPCSIRWRHYGKLHDHPMQWNPYQWEHLFFVLFWFTLSHELTMFDSVSTFCLISDQESCVCLPSDSLYAMAHSLPQSQFFFGRSPLRFSFSLANSCCIFHFDWFYMSRTVMYNHTALSCSSASGSNGIIYWNITIIHPVF